jgi:hypothetical protein
MKLKISGSYGSEQMFLSAALGLARALLDLDDFWHNQPIHIGRLSGDDLETLCRKLSRDAQPIIDEANKLLERLPRFVMDG